MSVLGSWVLVCVLHGLRLVVGVSWHSQARRVMIVCGEEILGEKNISSSKNHKTTGEGKETWSFVDERSLQFGGSGIIYAGAGIHELASAHQLFVGYLERYSTGRSTTPPELISLCGMNCG